MSETTFFNKNRTLILGVFFTLIILAVLVVLFNWVIMPIYTLHWSEKELPDVTEMTYEEAKKTLAAKGFEMIFDGEKFNQRTKKWGDGDFWQTEKLLLALV